MLSDIPGLHPQDASRVPPADCVSPKCPQTLPPVPSEAENPCSYRNAETPFFLFSPIRANVRLNCFQVSCFLFKVEKGLWSPEGNKTDLLAF